MRIRLVSAQTDSRDKLETAIRERLPEVNIHKISTIAAMYGTLDRQIDAVVIDPATPLRRDEGANTNIQTVATLVTAIRRRHPRCHIVLMGPGELTNPLLEQVNLVVGQGNIEHVAAWLTEVEGGN